MAISPVNITRVSHNLRTMSMLETLRRNTTEMFTQQVRLSTGRSFNTISENPLAAAQSLKMNESIDRQDQILSNLRHADTMLGSADNALVEVNDLLAQAESLASRSIGTQADADERSANAVVIASILEQLVAVGNRQVAGRYLFAGRDTDSAPFISALGGVAYMGDEGDVLARVARAEQETINVPGNELFGALSAAVTSSLPLDPVLTEETRLEDLAGASGRGVRKGVINIVDNSGGSVQVDLSKADTVGDVIDLFNARATEAGLTAELAIEGNGLSLTGGGVTVRDTSTGTTAADLGLIQTDPPATRAVNLNPPLTPTTLLASLNGGAGVSLGEGLRLSNGPESVVVDLSEAETIQDVINEINGSGIFVFAQISKDGRGMEIISRVSGVDLSVSENGGTTARDLGFNPFDETTRLDTLNYGQGVAILEGEPDLLLTAKDGSSVEVNLDGAETIGDVLDAINLAASDAGVSLEARLGDATNAIVIVDSTGGTGSFGVTRAHIASFAVDDLGLYKTQSADQDELVGDDVSRVRAEGIFTALKDLERALRDDDERGVTSAAARISDFSKEVSRVHGVIGARAQAMRSRVEQTENAVASTRAFLSEIDDLDYTEAVTRFQQAQTALQANLLSGSQILSVSLLDYLG